MPSTIVPAIPELLALAGLAVALAGERMRGGKRAGKEKRTRGDILFRLSAALLFAAVPAAVLLSRPLAGPAGSFGALRYLPLDADGAGGLLVLDPPALLFKGMIALIGLVAVVSGFSGGEGRRPFLPGLFGAAFAAFLIAGANDLLILWGGTELLALAARSAAASDPCAGRKFYRSGAFFSSLSLFGLLLFYGLFGTTELFALAGTLSARNVETVPANGLLIALLFLLGGMLARIGAALAEVSAGRRADSLPFFSLFVLATVAGYALVVRLVVGVFPPDVSGIEIGRLTAVIGSVIGIGCGLLAAGEDDPGRRIRYAAAAHVGMAILPLAVRSTFGFTAGITYLGIHLLLSLAVMPGVTGGERSVTFGDKMSSRGGRDLFTGVLLLALAGFPFTGGFLSRFFLLDSVLESDPSPLLPLVSGAIVSILLLYAYGRGLHALYFAEGFAARAAGRHPDAAPVDGEPAYRSSVAERVGGAVVGLCGVSAILCGFPGGFRIVWNFLRSWLSGAGG